MNPPVKQRIFGLDLLRALAIIIVILGHSSELLPPAIDYSIPLPDGVDLFFVLSGYLVGSILIRTVEENNNFNFLIALNFLIRRWFRTLPNYFLFLVINIVLVYFVLIPGEVNKYIVTYFVFFQNFFKPYDFIFWESWSLSVEEWFYLLFPFFLSLIFLIQRKGSHGNRKRNFLIAIGIMLIFPLVYRILQSSELLDTDLYFRKIVLTRLDTIGFGVLAAYLHLYFHSFWTKTKNLTFIAGILIVCSLLIFRTHTLFFDQTFRFTIMGVGIALLIPKLSLMVSGLIFKRPITYLSKISYSLYLVHIPAFFILRNMALPLHPALLYLLYWLVIVLISDLVYRFYETPLMNIRDKVKIATSKRN